MQKLNSPDFIRKLQRGNPLTFRELEESLLKSFRKYLIAKYNISKEDAKDIVQDVAIKIIKNIQDFDPGRSEFVPWAFKILHDCLYEKLKRSEEVT